MAEILPEHSQVGASSMDRWDSCPGSVKLCATMPNKSSSFAEEGTKAHEFGAYRLLNDKAPPNFEEFENDTIEAVAIYVDFIREIQKTLKPHPLNKFLVEYKFHVPQIHKDFHGTADCVIYDGTLKKLYVIDYKHGMGVPVSPEGNLQLMYYAIGVLRALNLPVEMVQVAIVQPRYDPDDAVKTWDVDVIDLFDFIDRIVQAIKATENPNALTVTGSHCQFCNAKPICPALKKDVELAVRADFAPEVLHTLDREEVGALMDKLDAIDAWVKGVREFGYQEALNGRPPAGFKLAQKVPRRKWTDPEVARKKIEMAVNQALLRDCYTDPELKSPAQLDKVLGKTQKALIESLTVKVSSGLTLVRNSDKRQGVDKKQIAEQMFGEE